MIKVKAKLARLPNTNRMMLELVRGMADFTDDMEHELKQPTLTWKSPVMFERHVDAGSTKLTATVETGDKRYVWTSSGTRPHKIRARKGKALRFAKVSRPKTRPGSLIAGSGISSGVAFAQSVNHPGTKARKFPQTAAKFLRPIFKFRIKNALRNAAEASGQRLK